MILKLSSIKLKCLLITIGLIYNSQILFAWENTLIISLNNQKFLSANKKEEAIILNLIEYEVYYKNKLSFDSYTDTRDGTKYKTIKIGNQIWFAENLRYLPSVVGRGTGSVSTPYYYVYDYNGNNVEEAKESSNYLTYGVLYNWTAAITACPDGWHLPNNDEWEELIDYLGGISIAGSKLKETGTIYWNSPNSGSNETGFSSLPGGYRSNYGTFFNIGIYGFWWSASEYDPDNAWIWYIFHNYDNIYNYNYFKDYGFSVRCLKN